MGLVNLTTNLKSLRYGKDRVGGGSSNQPYITKDLPKKLSDVGRTGGPDVLLRGGTLTPGRIVKDVSRLAQMFFDFKSIGGPLFIAKENLLSRTSVAVDGKGKALNNGVYLPTSTLLQAAGNSLGLHLNKQGIDPFKGIGKNGGGIFELFGGSDPLGQPSYIEITSNPTYESKLKGLTSQKINQKTDSIELLNYQGGPGSKLGIGKTRIPLSKDRTGLNNPNLNYSPARVSWSTKSTFQDNGFGFNNSLNITQNTDPFASNFSFSPGQLIVGRTGKPDVVPFRSISPTATDPEAQEKINNDQFLRLGASVKYASNLLKVQGANVPLVNSYLNVFRESWLSNGKLKLNPESFTVGDDILLKESSKSNPTIGEKFTSQNFSLDYKTNNIENRVGLGNPGKKGNVTNYQEGKKDLNGNKLGPLDKITSMPLYKSGVVTSSSDKNDLVKFRIGIIQNDDPSQKVFLHFRAFLDSMTDDYSADWAGEKLMGRGEQFYRYNGFDRSISLGWTVAAQSKEELMPMYRKLNYLASSLAPDYSQGSGYMRGNLATLTVGGYLYEQPGIITSLTYSIPEESPWEIAIPSNEELRDTENKILSDKSVKEMPHMIKVTGFNFIPIHEFTPRKQQNIYSDKGKLLSYTNERYIALKNGINENYNN